jgi:hypothetical protein
MNYVFVELTTNIIPRLSIYESKLEPYLSHCLSAGTSHRAGTLAITPCVNVHTQYVQQSAC